MSKQLCFYIENQSVYLDQVLVDYEEVPIFFLCKEREQFYLALCTDFEEFSYIVVKLTINDVYMLLHGKIPMRDVILKQRNFWEVISADEIQNDVVRKIPMSNIDSNVLPEENAYFKVLTDEMRNYVRYIDNKFFDKDSFAPNSSKNSTYLSEGELIEGLYEFAGNIKKWEILKEIHLDKSRDSKVDLVNESGCLLMNYRNSMKNVKSGVIKSRMIESSDWNAGDYPYSA